MVTCPDICIKHAMGSVRRFPYMCAAGGERLYVGRTLLQLLYFLLGEENITGILIYLNIPHTYDPSGHGKNIKIIVMDIKWILEKIHGRNTQFMESAAAV